ERKTNRKKNHSQSARLRPAYPPIARLRLTRCEMRKIDLLNRPIGPFQILKKAEWHMPQMRLQQTQVGGRETREQSIGGLRGGLCWHGSLPPWGKSTAESLNRP